VHLKVPFSDMAGEQDEHTLFEDDFRTVQLGVVGYHKAVNESLVLLFQVWFASVLKSIYWYEHETKIT
jgi:hypothetical protein